MIATEPSSDGPPVAAPAHSSTPHNVAAIVVTHNSARHIERCLLALRHVTRSATVHTVVVDNASADETLEIVARVDGTATILKNTTNTGYAAANNQALALLQPRAISYHLILNPDVVLPPGALDVLIGTMEADRLLGMVSPRVSRGMPDGPWSETEGARSLWGFAARPKRRDADKRFVDRLPGSCMLVRSSLFETVGVFDEAYFLYWEEIDLCRRARRAGFRLAVCLTIEAVHRPGEPPGAAGERAHRVYYMWRNQFRFAFKSWGALGSVFLIRRSVAMLREAVRFVRAGRFDLLRAGWCGLAAGLRGKRGKSHHPCADPDRTCPVWISAPVPRGAAHRKVRPHPRRVTRREVRHR
jgi:GT2 family glycosyltransferase